MSLIGTDPIMLLQARKAVQTPDLTTDEKRAKYFLSLATKLPGEIREAISALVESASKDENVANKLFGSDFNARWIKDFARAHNNVIAGGEKVRQFAPGRPQEFYNRVLATNAFAQADIGIQVLVEGIILSKGAKVPRRDQAELTRAIIMRNSPETLNRNEFQLLSNRASRDLGANKVSESNQQQIDAYVIQKSKIASILPMFAKLITE